MSEISKPLDKMIDQLSGYIHSTGDFVLEQAPEILTQICEWDFWSSIVWGTLLLFFSISAFIICRAFYNESKKDENEYEPGFAIMSAIFFAIYVGCLYGMTYHFCKGLQISKAPKYYIVKKIMSRDF